MKTNSEFTSCICKSLDIIFFIFASIKVTLKVYIFKKKFELG